MSFIIINKDSSIIRFVGDVQKEYAHSKYTSDIYAFYAILHNISGDIIIVTDSKDLIECVTNKMDYWNSISWENVKDKEIVYTCYQMLRDRKVSFKSRIDHNSETFIKDVKEMVI